MTLAVGRKAVILGLLDLERANGGPGAWDLAWVIVAAQKHHHGDGRVPDRQDVEGLVRSSTLLHRRASDGRYELTESARARAREGSL